MNIQILLISSYALLEGTRFSQQFHNKFNLQIGESIIYIDVANKLLDNGEGRRVFFSRQQGTEAKIVSPKIKNQSLMYIPELIHALEIHLWLA